MVDELPVGYYLTNFMLILDFVDQLYPDILSEEEKAFSNRFRGLTTDAQKLYVRLIGRKGPHFRSDKLNYPEIGSILEAAGELERADLLVLDDDRFAGEALLLLNRAELLPLLEGSRDVPGSSWKSRKKDALLEAALELPENVIVAALAERFHWLTPLGGDILLVYRLLFFGNLHQDLTEFVLVDLGLLRYEAVPINPADRLYHSRQLVADTLIYAWLREQMHLALEEGDEETLMDILNKMPNPEGERSLCRRRDRILEHCGQYFERARNYERASACFQRSESHPARERLARIHDRQGRSQSALEICQAILADSSDELELEFALQFRPKMQKKLSLEQDKTKRITHPTETMELERDESKHIEVQVLEYLAEQGIEAFYSENHLWRSIFGLVFWDIIFMPVRGAFFNPYQRGPKGLFSSEFREARLNSVQERLEEIRQGGAWRQRALDTFDRKQGTANYLVHWPALERELLARTLAVLNNQHLYHIMDRLTSNPGAFKTGLPDLFLFDGDSGYRLLEVKGPSDQLQNNQRRWLRYFARHDIPYAVAKVSWASD